MLVVVSFCNTDREQAVELAKRIEMLGGASKHACLMVSPAGVRTDGIFEPLKSSFSVVEERRFNPRFQGWPAGPNEQFAVAANQVARMLKVNAPWLWLEADCVPMRRGWIDDLEREWVRAGTGVIGVIRDSVRPNGEISGRHVVGVAVYPGGLANPWPTAQNPFGSPLVRNIMARTAGFLKAGKMPEPFDVYIQHELFRMATETTLIQHIWRARGFKQNGRGYVCETASPDIAEKRVSEHAVLVHGDKDGSLMALVTANHGKRVVREEPVDPDPIPRDPEPKKAVVQWMTRSKLEAVKPEPVAPVPPPQPQAPASNGFNEAAYRKQRTSDLNKMVFRTELVPLAKSMGIKGRRFEDLRDSIIDKEVAEKKKLEQPSTPAKAPVQFRAVDDNGLLAKTEGISDEMRQRILALRRERGLPIPT